MMDYVFDTEPLIAYFYGEPGAPDVTERLQAIEGDEASGAISHATATEVVYRIARLETGDPNQIPPGDDEFEVGEEDLRVLRGYGVTIATPSWSAVAQIKGAGGISPNSRRRPHPQGVPGFRPRRKHKRVGWGGSRHGIDQPTD